MQRFAGGGSGLPEIGLHGGGRREYYWHPANYLQQVPTPAPAITPATTMNASLDLAHAISDEVDRYLLLQRQQLKAAAQQQSRRDLSSLAVKLRSKLAMVMMQKDKDLADEKKEASQLIQLLKKVMAEKESWEKIARKMSIIIAALKQTITRAHQQQINNILMEEEEVASSNSVPCNHQITTTDDHDHTKYDHHIDDDEPAAAAVAVKRSKKRRRLNSSSSSSSNYSSVLCKNCRSNFSSVVLLPCRHVSLCVHCASLRTMCPHCNHPISDAIEIVFE